jgi:predicted nucleotidyltransferase
MTVNKPILQQIKGAIGKVEPHATVILYGSYARGDVNNNSDIDLLVLLDKDKITRDDERKIFDPLYDIEFPQGFSSALLFMPGTFGRTGIMRHC